MNEYLVPCYIKNKNTWSTQAYLGSATAPGILSGRARLQIASSALSNLIAPHYTNLGLTHEIRNWTPRDNQILPHLHLHDPLLSRTPTAIATLSRDLHGMSAHLLHGTGGLGRGEEKKFLSDLLHAADHLPQLLPSSVLAAPLAFALLASSATLTSA